MREQPSKAFPKINVSPKKTKSMKNSNWVLALNLSGSNFTTIKTPSQIASKNFAKILIYLFMYIFL